jgi:hypothetical protein
LAPFAFPTIAALERGNQRVLAMSRRIRVRGDQREELELTRLAQALLRAAREAAERQEVKEAKPSREARDDA